MNQHPTTCDPARIELFLRQQLSDGEQAAFELHLNDCVECRHRLETAAAGDDVWLEVRESLSMESTSGGASPFDSSAGEELAFGHDSVLSLLAPTDDERMLGRLGTYEVVGVIGSGGMGVVLKAFDPALNRYVAIKVLAPHLGHSGAARKRFSREAQAAAAVVHDNVIEIHGVSDVEGLPYLVMPYVRGPSLQRRLDVEGPLALVEILRIGMQAAAGLAAAHAQGLVHRDVKPANILLADGVERVKLTDFGLARAADDASLTRTGLIAGTPQYMSPEQSRGDAIDQRSDLFSLGSVLYAMCTGRAPFRAETSYGVLRRITDDQPRPIREINPDIPEWFCRVVERLMAKLPGDRFTSASEVAELLEECLAHVQQPTVAPLPSSLGSPSHGRRVFSVARRFKGVIAMFAAVSVLGMVFWQSAAPPDISGTWTGREWGEVVLEQTQPGHYAGTYTDTFGDNPGTLQLKWSRIERRFNGTWREAEDRFGKISVRLVEDEIRGAWTTNRKSGINPGTPELADLSWVRGDAKGVVDRASNPVAFQPFDCVLVDKKTKESIPGNEFSIGFVFEIPKTETRPWQLVDEVFLGPDHAGKFQFTIPEKVLKHPDRELIQVRWGVVHPTLDLAGGYDPPRVNEILFDDPRTARESLRTIALHPANIRKGDRPDRYNEFTARVFLLQRLGVLLVGRDQLVALYEDLLKRFPTHPDRALAMYELAGLWQQGIPDSTEAPDSLKESSWLREACAAAREGTPTWYESRFRLQASLHHASPEESLQILDEIQAHNPGPVEDVRAWNERVTIALSADNEELAEDICRRLHDRMGQQENQPEDKRELGDYYSYIQSSAYSLLSYWFHQQQFRGVDRQAKIEALVNDYPFRHMQRYHEELPTIFHAPMAKSAPKRFNSEDIQNGVTGQPTKDQTEELAKLATGLPHHRPEDPALPHSVEPPSPLEVIRALEKQENIEDEALTNLYTRHRDRFRVVVEALYDKVDSLRFYPTVGVARLHRVRFECTVFFTETVDAKWPVDHKMGKNLRKVLTIDADHLDVIEPIAAGVQETPSHSKEAILTAREAAARGQELYHSRRKVTARFKVAGVVTIKVTDEQGKTSEWWKLMAEGAEDFSAQLSPEVQALYQKAGIVDLNQHFKGKEIEVEGQVVAVGLDLISRPETIWSYHIKVIALRQLRPVTTDRKGEAGVEREMQLHPDHEVTVVACSRDGEWIAFAIRPAEGGSTTVEIRQVETEQRNILRITTDEEDAILSATKQVSHVDATALAFSPDRTWLSVGTSIGQIKLFDAQTGDFIRSLDDQPARLADTETPENWKAMVRGLGSVGGLAFSADGTLLAACGESFADYSDVFDGVERLGRKVGGSGRLKVWDVATGELKHDLPGHSWAGSCAFAPEGNVLASAGRWDSGNEHGSGVLVWDLDTGKQIRTIGIETNGGTHAVSFAPNRKLIAVGSVNFDKENDTRSSTITIAYPLSGIVEWQRTLPGWAMPVSFSPDGTQIVVLDQDRKIRLFDAATGQDRATHNTDEDSLTLRWNSAAMAPDGRRLVVGGIDRERRGLVEIWRIGDADQAP